MAKVPENKSFGSLERLAIIKCAADLERSKEDKSIPMHPRVHFLESDLDRAMRILEDAGFRVIAVCPKEE